MENMPVFSKKFTTDLDVVIRQKQNVNAEIDTF